MRGAVIVCGIDPGKDGGYVELDDAGAIRYMGRLYTDHAVERLHLVQWERCHVFMERAQVMNRPDKKNPDDPIGRPPSAVAMFSYGTAFGRILGMLEALRIPHTLVRPADWTRAMHHGTKDDLDTKKRSLETARRIFPGVRFITGDMKKDHDGIYEAAVIAEWGRRQLSGARAPGEVQRRPADQAGQGTPG